MSSWKGELDIRVSYSIRVTWHYSVELVESLLWISSTRADINQFFTSVLLKGLSNVIELYLFLSHWGGLLHASQDGGKVLVYYLRSLTALLPWLKNFLPYNLMLGPEMIWQILVLQFRTFHCINLEPNWSGARGRDILKLLSESRGQSCWYVNSDNFLKFSGVVFWVAVIRSFPILLTGI